MDQDKLRLMRQANYIDPALAEELKNGAPAVSLDKSTDVHALRQQLLNRKLEAAANTPHTFRTKETDIQIKARDGGQITLRIYQPLEGADAKAPVLVMLHGGGWVLGGLDNEAPLCSRWVEHFNGVSFNIDYRLAPEFKFPTAVYDSYDALLWVKEHAHEYGGDLLAGFVLAGISAGASMTAAISHLYRDDGHSPPLTGLYLSIPLLLAPEVLPEKYSPVYTSRQDFKNGLVINEKAMEFFTSCYREDPKSPLFSPAIWPSGHHDLPRTYFQIAGSDPLRDDALIYEEMLRRDFAILTKVDLYPGLPHGFWTWWPKARFSQKQAVDAVEGLRWLLG